MASPAIAVRNRANAQRSTGARSAAGKAIVARNAIRHGLRMVAPVVPGLEREQDWQRHLQATCESLAPTGHLETVLCERVALQFWRLGRVARYEHRELSRLQAQVEADIAERRRTAVLFAPQQDRLQATWPEDIRGEAEYTALKHTLLERLPAMADDEPISGEDAHTIISLLCAACVPGEGEDVPIPGAPSQGEEEALEDYCVRVAWTGALMRAALGAFAAHAGEDAAALLARLTYHGGCDMRIAASRLEEVEREVGWLQGQRLLPDGDTLDKLQRYEAHLERSLARNLHELERLQARRHGQPVVPPVAVDVSGLEG